MPSFDELRLETPRLVLRPPRLEDLDPWSAMMADEATARFIGGVMDRPLCWRQIMTMIGAWHAHGFAMFSVIEKASGRWVGRLGPWRPEGWPGPEIGWSIVRDRWGRGYAVEGSRAAADWAFDALGWTEMVHAIAPENVQSQRVAQKLGSRLRAPATLPPPFADAVVELWGQTRDEWRARTTQASVIRSHAQADP